MRSSALEGVRLTASCGYVCGHRRVRFNKSILTCRGQRVVYTTPLKALSNQKLFEMRLRFGAPRVGLQTGDATLNVDRDIVVMTTEILRNIMYRTEPGTEGETVLLPAHMPILQGLRARCCNPTRALPSGSQTKCRSMAARIYSCGAYCLERELGQRMLPHHYIVVQISQGSHRHRHAWPMWG